MREVLWERQRGGAPTLTWGRRRVLGQRALDPGAERPKRPAHLRLDGLHGEIQRLGYLRVRHPLLPAQHEDEATSGGEPLDAVLEVEHLEQLGFTASIGGLDPTDDRAFPPSGHALVAQMVYGAVPGRGEEIRRDRLLDDQISPSLPDSEKEILDDLFGNRSRVDVPRDEGA